MTIKDNPKPKIGSSLGPIQYSILLTLMLPLGVLLIVFCAGLLALTWPLVPFLSYFQRLQEIKETEQKEKQLELFND